MNRKKIVSHFLYSQKVAPYVFILPFILTFSIFFVYPVINTVAMSFQKVSGSGNTLSLIHIYSWADWETRSWTSMSQFSILPLIGAVTVLYSTCLS